MAVFDREFATNIVSQMSTRGVGFAEGLSDAELAIASGVIGRPMPPDLAALLQTALPVMGPDREPGEIPNWRHEFPNWRSDPEGVMERARDHVAGGVRFDVLENDFWVESWGQRPSDLHAAARLAEEKLAVGPPLVPIYAHRFMPTEPEGPGAPVLSMWQAVDTIYYGYDLADYLHREFGVERPAWAADSPPPSLPFWGNIFEDF